ncbi:MAG: diaminopimelate epimerase [Planctomycetes bacterium]|nr:diaminopimelate epimerase [Planctomycetota bacterium]
MRVPFTKMEGCGNDYVLVDGLQVPLPLDRAAALARAWSDRHFGIGADGLIVLGAGQRAPVRMSMWNADGSRGAMCGNGLRCLARLAFAHGHLRERRFPVETDAGVRRVELLDDAVRTWMGTVTCAAPRRFELAGRGLELVPGDAGNPHAVCFVDDVELTPVVELGVALQRDPFFPDGVNVEFVQSVGPDRLRQRTFERGSGETLACGTGAAVAVVAARARGVLHGERAVVELRGGTLHVTGDSSTLAIEGPARTVFTGSIELPE